MSGYDLENLKKVNDLVKIPIIASSGAGSLQNCIDAFNTGVSAISVSSMFIFTDHSPIKIRSHLWSKNVDVRASKSSRS